MSKKKELGKGIKALLANMEQRKVSDEDVSNVSSPSLIDIEKIEANPDQPRRTFESGSMADLVKSIETYGIIQPLTLRKLSHSTYQIIAGERRWRAAQKVGLQEVPAYVRTANDSELLEMALVENIQREDLNALEVAISYDRLIREFQLTQESLADRIGKKRSTVANYLRLLKLPPDIQSAIKEQRISMGHARVLAGIPDSTLQLDIFRQILLKSLSVRQTEQMAKKGGSSKTKIENSDGLTSEVLKIRDQLSDRFGRKINIKRSAKGKGHIVIPFNDDHGLNDILEILNP